MYDIIYFNIYHMMSYDKNICSAAELIKKVYLMHLV